MPDAAESPALEEFGNRIGLLRQAAGLTQEQLSRMVGMSRSSIANMEAGRQEPGIVTINALAHALGVSASELLGGTSQHDILPWLELATRVTASERTYRAEAEKAWAAHEYLAAVRFRGIADGLELARDHHAQLLAARRFPSPVPAVGRPTTKDHT